METEDEGTKLVSGKELWEGRWVEKYGPVLTNINSRVEVCLGLPTIL